MNKSTYHIALEIDRHVSQGSMSVRRGESGRELVLALLSGGKPYDPGEGAYAVLAAKKPDGTTLFNGCLLKNGRIHYILTAQTTAAPGRAECEARIYDANGELIVSPKFALVIYETAIEDEEVSSSSEATALTALVSEAKRALEDIDAAGISACEVTVDANSGAPSALAEMKADARGKILALTFSGLKGADGANGAPGEKGEKGDRGEIGPAFTYADFTPEQLAALKGEKGETGIDGKDGAPGEKGDKGDTGERGEKGEKGDKGDAGAAFTVRGFYQSAEALSAAVTAPSVGDAYGVGDSAPYDIYIYDTATAAWVNNGPLQGAKGETGAAFTYEDFTPEQLAALKGEKGEAGKDGEKGEKGDKGETGAAFTYADFTPEQLAALKGEKGDSGQNGTDGAKGDKGEKGEKGAKGDKGDTGAAFTYADFTPEQLAALKGDKGETGERGEKGDKGDTGATGATGAQGAKGDKGDKGDTFTFDDLTSVQIAALKGDKGDTGEAGHTPVRGTDYWTAEDQTAIVNAVLDALPSGDEVSY